jgi:hypothetical protein
VYAAKEQQQQHPTHKQSKADELIATDTTTSHLNIIHSSKKIIIKKKYIYKQGQQLLSPSLPHSLSIIYILILNKVLLLKLNYTLNLITSYC